MMRLSVSVEPVMEGHLIARITKNIDKISHFHAAGNPGRHELGLEYFPLEDSLLGIWRLLNQLKAAGLII